MQLVSVLSTPKNKKISAGRYTCLFEARTRAGLPHAVTVDMEFVFSNGEP